MMRGNQPPPKVEDTGGVEAGETEVKIQPKQSGTKSEKTRAEKDKHNERCRQSRLNKKQKYKMLEVAFAKLKAENKKAKMEREGMKMEHEEMQSKLRDKENELQQLKRNLELPKRLVSQNYVQEGQVSGTSENVLHDGNEFVGLGTIGTANFPLSMADIYQQMGFCQDNANITTSSAVRPSFVANRILPSVTMFAGQGYTSTTSSAAPGSSSVANHGLPFVSDTPTSYHGPVDTNIIVSAVAGSSSVANHGFPVESDTLSSHHGQEHTNITASAAGSFVSDILSSHCNKAGVLTVPDSFGENSVIVSDPTNSPEDSDDVLSTQNLVSWFGEGFGYHDRRSLLDP